MQTNESNQVEFLPVIDGVVREDGIVRDEDLTKTITYTPSPGSSVSKTTLESGQTRVVEHGRHGVFVNTYPEVKEK